MSAPSNGTRPPSFDVHPLVSKLHPDPDAVSNYQTLVGYFGHSKKDGNIRLYTDLTFLGYFDISKADIVSTQAANQQDENSPTVVFVKSDGKVEIIQTPGTNTDFLKGAISSANLASAAGRYAAVPQPGQNAGCCGTFWTAGCTFASNAAPQAGNAAGCPVITFTTFCTIGHQMAQAQGPNAGCCGTFWTAGCTFPSNAAPQAGNAAGCPVITFTTFCTIGHQMAQTQGPNAGCCGTFWTAGCTFPSNAAPQAAAVNTCVQLFMTTLCTVGANVAPAQGPNVGCCGTFWTAGCTFPSNA